MSSDTSDVSHRSSRDLDAVGDALRAACAQHWPEGRNHKVSGLQGTTATGMSSETLLFDLAFDNPDGSTTALNLVARVAPDPADVPVFPSYDMPGQFKTIQTVAELTDVPVPPPLWHEADPSVIGSPFFIMGKVEGLVPPDVMPYTFGDNWLFDAPREQQARLQESTIAAIAGLHAIPEPQERFAHLQQPHPGDTALRRHVAGRRAWYEFAARSCGRSELVESGFRWLEDHWPDESGTVFSWGDSRIGNILYRDFEPAAVLDWEMAGLGPAELDIAWLVYLHQMFEDICAQMGLPGMPHFLQVDDVASTYERITGKAPRDLDWYITYSCLQLGIVFMRTSWRQVHFGDRPMPASVDELIMNASTLAQMISG
jgi:aminoglycoside phosphotransferase (APT) family kinase protein